VAGCRELNEQLMLFKQDREFLYQMQWRTGGGGNFGVFNLPPPSKIPKF
jgi:hypothetical protein